MKYDLPTVQVNPEPMTPAAAPETKNFAAAQQTEQGAAITKAGDAVTKMVETYKDDVATAKVKDADNRLVQHLTETLYNPDTGFFAAQGEQAVNGQKDALKSVQDFVKKDSAAMTDPVEQAMYRKVSNARLNDATAKVYAHTMEQGKIWRLSATKSRAELFAQTAINNAENPESKDYQTAVTSARGEWSDYASKTGMSEDATKLYIQSQESLMHKAAVDQLISRDQAVAAKTYFDNAVKNKQILPGMQDEIRTKVDTEVSRVQGKQTADDVFAKTMKDITINDAIPEEKMIKEIEADTGLTTKGKQDAMAKLHDNLAKYAAQKRQGEEAASNQVYGMMTKDADRGQYSQVMKAIDLANVDKQAKFNLKAHADTFYHISEDRQTAKLEEKLKQNVANLGRVLQFENDYASGNLGKMEPKDVAKYVSQFGASTDDAMRFVRHANDLADNVKVTMEGLKNELRIMKQNPAFKDLKTFPDPDSTDSSAKADMALLQNNVIGLMAASGKAGPGKQMSVQQALATALKPVITDKGVFWDTTSPVYKLGTTSADNPKNWSDETKTAFIRSHYYRKNAAFPTGAEFDRLKKELEK